MTLALVFNDASLPYDEVKDAELAVLKFIKTVLACRKYGFDLVLIDTVADKSWFSIELAQKYYWRNWFDWANTQGELKESVRAFRSLQTRQPMLLPEEHSNLINSLEVGLKGESNGLATLQAAYCYQTFLIGFPTKLPWNQFLIDIWVLTLQEDGSSTENESELKNLFDNGSLLEHENELKAIRNERLKVGGDIWENREMFFPNITLLDNSIGGQLRGWTHRPDILNKAKHAMLIMNEFVQSWKEGKYKDYRHEYFKDFRLSSEVSGESKSVNDDPKKKAEREFWLPTGRKVYCENHVKLQDGFRLHFYPDSEEKTIYVAYLGPHLTL